MDETKEAIMQGPRELTPQECADLLATTEIGRLAICTPMGPQIYPLNYALDGNAIVFRTTPYSTLGTLGWGVNVAFEVDHLDWADREGWSVIIKGRADIIDDPAEVDRLRERGLEPTPWAKGMRRLYVRVPWREITGRFVGDEWLSGVPAALRPRA
jgi:nitroimidazol reductase NimA-like FMN-containing flavoprotein (pyridoxamine 5'-phosphate oxidase superfamily)